MSTSQGDPSYSQQRPATADEIAAVVKFLGQPEASYLSGQILAVDGGATAAFAGLPLPRRRDKNTKEVTG